MNMYVHDKKKQQQQQMLLITRKKEAKKRAQKKTESKEICICDELKANKKQQPK